MVPAGTLLYIAFSFILQRQYTRELIALRQRQGPAETNAALRQRH